MRKFIEWVKIYKDEEDGLLLMGASILSILTFTMGLAVPQILFVCLIFTMIFLATLLGAIHSLCGYYGKKISDISGAIIICAEVLVVIASGICMGMLAVSKLS